MFDSNRSDDPLNSGDELIAVSQFKKRVVEVQNAESPLLEAARPLLRAASDMRSQQVHENMREFQDMLIREMKLFQNLAEQANVKKEHVIGCVS